MLEIEKIRRQCLFRLRDRKKYGRRLAEELQWISENGRARTLLLTADLIGGLRRDGHRAEMSGAGPYSLVCYGLSLTDIDPVEWNLPFGMFTEEFDGEVPTVSVDTSTLDDGVFPPKSYKAPEGVTMVREEYLTADAVFYDEDMPDCMFAACESFGADLLKAYQALSPTDIRNTRPDERTVRNISETGFDGFNGLPKDADSPILKGVRPESFADLCLVYALTFPHMEEQAERIFAVRAGAGIPTTGDPNADRLLRESYGTAVWEEQRRELAELVSNDTVGGIVPGSVEELLWNLPVDLPSKAAALRSVRESVLCTEFRREFPEEYGAEYRKLDAIRQRSIEKLRRTYRL